LPSRLSSDGLCIGPPFLTVQFSKINPAFRFRRAPLNTAAATAILTRFVSKVKFYFFCSRFFYFHSHPDFQLRDVFRTNVALSVAASRHFNMLSVKASS
jgi:hypothetical protein